MKQRLRLATLSLFAVLLVVTLVSASQVSSQEPITVQRDAAISDAQPQAPAAPTSLLFNYQGQLLNANSNPITNPATPMIFRLYTVSTGGTPCWSESRTVDVRSGVFNVLLGQVAAINSGCLAGDAYLELVVDGETLTPRERLTSVAHAVEASTLSAGAVTRGGISLSGPIDMRHDAIVNLRAVSAPSDAHLDIMWGQSQDMFVKSSANGNLYVGMGGNVNVGISGNVNTGGDTNVGGYNLRLGGSGDDRVALRRDGGRTLHLLPWGGSNYAWDNVCIGCGSTADLIVNGNMDLRGSCTMASNSPDSADAVTVADKDCVAGSITSGAYVEANLMRPEERNSDSIERFERGDLLCWSAANEQLELCTKANDRLVMAVADPNGRPIVIGAEPVKVLGPVEAGDILVSSDVAGYAMVNNDPKPGTVIGQALESFDGEMGLIKAMVRKW